MNDDRVHLNREYVSSITNVDSNKVEGGRNKKKVIPNQSMIDSLQRYKKDTLRLKEQRQRLLKIYGYRK